MAKEIINLRDTLREYRFAFDLLQKIPCSKQENQKYQKLLQDGNELPDDVFAYVYDNGDTSTTDFYTVYKTDLTESEIAEYLTLKKLSLIKTIKNCTMFFTVLTIIGMVACLIMLIAI